jgi:tetratricopeptide (TPR) repeat protein
LAGRHNERGIQLEKSGSIAEAIVNYQKAIKLSPSWAVPWFNLGLLRKRQHNWVESLRCNQRAVALDPTDQAAWWNLGIAATAVGDWEEARRAWKAFGVRIPDGEGPINMNIGLTPIRINAEDLPEVVWCRRIDPARAIIAGIPLPQSGHRFGDLLLHDGSPNGYRKVGNKETPVFDELELLEPSDHGTFEALVDGAEDGEIEDLVVVADEAGLAAEDWTMIRHLCKACSEGRPFGNDHSHPRVVNEARRIGLAALSEFQARQLLNNWLKKHPHAQLIGFKCALQPATEH